MELQKHIPVRVLVLLAGLKTTMKYGSLEALACLVYLFMPMYGSTRLTAMFGLGCRAKVPLALVLQTMSNITLLLRRLYLELHMVQALRKTQKETFGIYPDLLHKIYLI